MPEQCPVFVALPGSTAMHSTSPGGIPFGRSQFGGDDVTFFWKQRFGLVFLTLNQRYIGLLNAIAVVCR